MNERAKATFINVPNDWASSSLLLDTSCRKIILAALSTWIYLKNLYRLNIFQISRLCSPYYFVHMSLHYTLVCGFIPVLFIPTVF